MNSSESSKFFEFGEVKLEEHDFITRQASIKICMPCCLFQAVTPSLLGAGLIDQFAIREPISVWIPQFTIDRLSQFAGNVDDIAAQLNSTLKVCVQEVLMTFQKCAHVMLNPSDLIPIFPLGTYINFRFRCRVDDIPNVLIGVQNTPVDGVHEFQWALATVLTCVLEDFKRREDLKSLQSGS